RGGRMRLVGGFAGLGRAALAGRAGVVPARLAAAERVAADLRGEVAALARPGDRTRPAGGAAPVVVAPRVVDRRLLARQSAGRNARRRPALAGGVSSGGETRRRPAGPRPPPPRGGGRRGEPAVAT